MPDELQLFEDRAKRKPVKNLDFIRVPCGSYNEKTLYLSNDSNDWSIKEIKCKVRDPDVTIEYPRTLQPKQTTPIRIIWKPGLDRRTALDEQELFTGELRIGE